MSGLFLFLFLLIAYLLAVYALNVTGRLGGSLELMGPFLMMRTQRGKPAIERIAKARRLWAVFGDVGIVLTAVAGVLMLGMLILQVYLFARSPRLLSENAPPAEYLIGLPGVNPLIPVWYGIFGLVVALVVHEGCHGILSRHADIRVKSLGLLWFIVPIGAFVEPDEADLERKTPRQRNRMFAAGPTSNLVLAVAAGVLFSSLVMANVAVPQEGQGILVRSVERGYGAEQAGVQPGSILTEIDGVPVRDYASFAAALQGIPYNETAPPKANLTLLRAGVVEHRTVNLTSKYAYLESLHRNDTRYPTPDERARNQSFLGVSTFGLGDDPGNPMGPAGSVAGLRNLLAHPLSHGIEGFNFYVYYPFFALGTGVDVLNAPYNDYVAPAGPFEGMNKTAFFVLANALYWLFWLNLMLGTFNALPAGPLDGGQMFRTTFRGLLWRYYGVDRAKTRVEPNLQGPGVKVLGADDETQRKLDRAHALVRKASMTLGFFILILILTPLIAPHLVGLFG